MEQSDKQVVMNIDKFRDQAQENSSVVTVEDIKRTMQAHSSFDWEEFKKPYQEIDYKKIVQSLDLDKITSQWVLRPDKGTKGVSKASKFINYEMKTGHVFTIGSSGNYNNNQLLLQDVQSQFCQHKFKFADDSCQKMLNVDIEEIIKSQAPEIRKLAKFDISFIIDPETQSEQTLEQLKYMILMHEIATVKIGVAHDPKQTCLQHEGSGFIKQVYDEKKQQDIYKMVLGTQGFKVNKNGTQMLEIINVSNPNIPYSEENGLVVEDISYRYKTMNQLMKGLQNQKLDLVVQFEGAVVSKDGKKLSIKPKMSIVQVITQGAQQQQRRSMGLNLSKWLK